MHGLWVLQYGPIDGFHTSRAIVGRLGSLRRGGVGGGTQHSPQ